MSRTHRRTPSPTLAVLAATMLVTATTAQTLLLRHPDVHGDRVVFTHGGDLWRAAKAGGTAVRLTALPGVELFAKFSPDGRWIAFTSQQNGDEQVFVMPSDGGELTQLTWYPATGPLPDRWGYDHQVCGWTRDGSAVVFRSLREAWTLTRGRLYTVPVPDTQRRTGALPIALPMPQAGAGSFSPDGARIAYTPLFRDFRTWKRYEGGWAQEVYVFDTKSGQAKNLSNHVRADRDPMWIGDRVWFSSDRTGTNNLWSCDPDTGTLEQETQSTQWDVRWPSAGGPDDHCVVFEQAGRLRWIDTDSRELHDIEVLVPDDGRTRRAERVSARGLIEDYALSPGGRRAVFAARGEVLTVPKEHGFARNLTRSSGAHDKAPAFSPDGTTIAYISDASGEEQIWLVDHLGQSRRQLTQDLRAMLYTPDWSPDQKLLAFSDKDGVLRICDVATGALTVVADEPHGQLHDHAWSPCSGWLTFSMTDAADVSKVWLYRVADQSLHRVSRELCNDRSPVFGPKGERLFFLGLRGFQPRLPGAYEWDFQVDRGWGIYALTLRRDLEPLFDRRSDEAVEREAEAADDNDEGFTAPITIDLDGLADRVETVPVPLDNYDGLAAADGHLLYVRSGGSYYGRASDRPTTLHAFSLSDREPQQLASGVSGYALSADQQHVLIRTGSTFAIAAASTKGKDDQHQLDLADLATTKVAADEYAQIFDEVWRRYRDFFYVANMHGHDWVALRDKYRPLVEHVRHRSDLNQVIGEMIAELNVGHAYISGGDLGAPDRPATALLGCTLRFDQQSGSYRIAEVLAGENDSTTYRSPATAVGVELMPGDHVLAIDGIPLTPQQNPYRLLQHKRDRAVSLQVKRTLQDEAARVVTIDPIGSHSNLHYHAWVEHNRRRVHELSEGKLGYMHLPNMGQEGIREFIRQYYPQLDKQGMVVDDRYNGGGNVSQMVLNRLSRNLLLPGFGRTTGYSPYPSALFHGHLVCLINETSASDGDIFPAMFRAEGLGPLIGKRTWGGIIGITNRGMLMDGGTVNVPEFGHTEPGDAWTIEGTGVAPDIEVDNDVASVLKGKDPQLEKGVELLLQKVAAEPRPQPQPPAPPIKTGR